MGKAKKTKSKRARMNSDASSRKDASTGNGDGSDMPHDEVARDAPLDGDVPLTPVADDESDDKSPPESEQHVDASEPAPRDKRIESSKDIEPSNHESADGVVGPPHYASPGQWPVDLSKVDVVRERESKFIVFIDEALRVRWLAAFSPADLSDDSQSVIARARLLAATPTTYFEEGQQKAWMRMIGESLALALSGDVDNSKRTLSMAETFIAARARETARLWYIKASLLAFLALAVLGLIISSVPLVVEISGEDTASWFEPIGIAVFFGAIGSQFSVLLRLSTLSVDPGAGRGAHYVAALSRILLGAFAAVIAVVVVQADIILGFLNDSTSKNAWLIPTVALLAGVSERFVPGILQKVETSSLEKGSMVGGEYLAEEQRSESTTKDVADARDDST